MTSDGNTNSKPILFKRKPLRVLVSLVTLAAFFTTTVLHDAAWAVMATPIFTGRDVAVSDGPGNFKELNVDAFTLPVFLGTVNDHYNAGEGSRTVIHIQDAHCNYACQMRISEIIGYLAGQYGIRSVNLEGGAGEYDLSIFTRIHDKDIRHKVADYFVKEGLVNGAEFFAINNPDKAELWGVEDVELYIANLNAYRDSSRYRDEVERHMRTFRHIFGDLKRHMYSAGMRELDLKYSSYKSGSIGLKEYLEWLIRSSGENGIDIDSFPNISLLNLSLSREGDIDFDLANIQRKKLIDELEKLLSRRELERFVIKTLEFRRERISPDEYYAHLSRCARLTGVELDSYSDLQNYMAYISAYEAVDKTRIMPEIELLGDNLREILCRDTEEEQLALLSKHLSLMENLFGINLTKEDYRYYRANRPSFNTRDFTVFIDTHAPRYGITARPDAAVIHLDRYREEMELFYEYAFKRDEAFLENLYPGDNGIIITGGFHTENIADLFRNAGISYVSIIPRFKNCEDYESPYSALLAGEIFTESRKVLDSLGVTALAVASIWNQLGQNNAVRMPRELAAAQIEMGIRIARATGLNGIEIATDDGRRRFDLNGDPIIDEDGIEGENFYYVSLQQLFPQPEALIGSLTQNNPTEVVGAEGNPRVVYHGTPSGGFGTFDLTRVGESSQNMGWYGKGLYFSAKPEVASGYAGFDVMPGAAVYPAHVTIRNPFQLSTQVTPQVISRMLGLVGWTNKQKEILGQKLRAPDTFVDAAGIPLDTADFLQMLFDRDVPDQFPTAEKWTNLLKANGYDGVFVEKDGEPMYEIVVFEPGQVHLLHSPTEVDTSHAPSLILPSTRRLGERLFSFLPDTGTRGMIKEGLIGLLAGVVELPFTYIPWFARMHGEQSERELRQRNIGMLFINLASLAALLIGHSLGYSLTDLVLFDVVNRIVSHGLVWNDIIRPIGAILGYEIAPLVVEDERHSLAESPYSREMAIDGVFKGVDLEHFVVAQTKLAEKNLSGDTLRIIIGRLNLELSDEHNEDEIYKKIWEFLAKTGYSKEIIDLINGETYQNPELTKDVERQNKNPRLQSIFEAIANSLDAHGYKIGQFGIGVKQVLRWLSENRKDRVEVFTRTSDGMPYQLTLIKDEHGQHYIQIHEISHEKFLSIARESGGSDMTHGTVVRVSVEDKIPRTKKEGTQSQSNSQEVIIGEIHKYFPFVAEVDIFTQIHGDPEQKVNDFDSKVVVVPPGDGTLSHADTNGRFIRVSVSDRHITVADNGRGMEAGIIARMFVPHEGTKHVESFDERTQAKEKEKVKVIYDPGQARRISFSRNGRIITAVDIPKEICSQATLEGGLFVDLAGLIDVSASWDNIRIPVSFKPGTPSDFQAGIEYIVEQILERNMNLSDIEKVKFINTLTVGLDGLIRANANFEQAVKIIRGSIQQSLSPVIERIRAEGVVILPHDRQFDKLALPAGREVVFLHEKLFDWHWSSSMESLGGQVVPEVTFGTENRRILVVAPFTKESTRWIRIFSRIWHFLSRDERIPLIKTDRFIAIPRELGQKVVELIEKRKKGLSDDEEEKLKSLLEKINIITGEVVVTSYEVAEVMTNMNLAPLMRAEPGRVDTAAIDGFLAYPPSLRVSVPDRAGFDDAFSTAGWIGSPVERCKALSGIAVVMQRKGLIDHSDKLWKSVRVESADVHEMVINTIEYLAAMIETGNHENVKETCDSISGWIDARPGLQSKKTLYRLAEINAKLGRIDRARRYLEEGEKVEDGFIEIPARVRAITAVVEAEISTGSITNAADMIIDPRDPLDTVIVASILNDFRKLTLVQINAINDYFENRGSKIKTTEEYVNEYMDLVSGFNWGRAVIAITEVAKNVAEWRIPFAQEIFKEAERRIKTDELDVRIQYIFLSKIAAAQAEAGLVDDAVRVAGALPEGTHKAAAVAAIGSAYVRTGKIEEARTVLTEAVILGGFESSAALIPIAILQAEIAAAETEETDPSVFSEMHKIAGQCTSVLDKLHAFAAIAVAEHKAGLTDMANKTINYAKDLLFDLTDLVESPRACITIAEAQKELGIDPGDMFETAEKRIKKGIPGSALADQIQLRCELAVALSKAGLADRSAGVFSSILTDMANFDDRYSFGVLDIILAFTEAGRIEHTTSLLSDIKYPSGKAYYLTEMAKVQMKNHQNLAAKDSITRAISLVEQSSDPGPDKLNALISIAEAQTELGLNEQAGKTLHKVREVASRFEDHIDRTSAFLRIGLILEKLGNLKKARMYFDQAIARYQTEDNSTKGFLLYLIIGACRKSDVMTGIMEENGGITRKSIASNDHTQEFVDQEFYRELALSQADKGKIEEALKTAEKINSGYDKSKVFSHIAIVQAKAAGSRTTREFHPKAPRESEDEAVELWNKEILPKRDIFIRQAQSGYQPILDCMSDHGPEEFHGQIKDEVKEKIGSLYERQERMISENFQDFAGGKPLVLDFLPFERFCRETALINEALPGFLTSLKKQLSQEEYTLRAEIYRQFFANLMEVGIDLKGNEHIERVDDDFLMAIALGWKPSTADQVMAISVLTEFITALRSVSNDVLNFEVSLKIFELLAGFSKKDPELNTRVMAAQLSKILALKPLARDKFLADMITAFSSLERAKIKRYLQSPQEPINLGRARSFAFYLTHDVKHLAEKEWAAPKGEDIILPEGGISISQIIKLDQQRRKKGPRDFMTMDYLLNNLNDLPERSERMESVLGRYVTGQRESGAYTAEIAQNSRDATRNMRGELVIDFYCQNNGTEYVEEASDNGTGALNEIALIIDKSSKDLEKHPEKFLQDLEETGCFGTGKYTMFEGVDRLEIITRNNDRAFMFTYNVQHESGKLPKISLTGIRKIDDDRLAKGVTVRRIKSTENTVPELDCLLAKRAWRDFAGLSQDEHFTIYFVDDEGEKAPLTVKQEQLAEVGFKVELPGQKTEDFGSLRLISAEDMPLQIVERAGLRVSEIKPEYLELVPRSFHEFVPKLGITIQIPLSDPIWDRSAFKDEDVYLPFIQRYVAIAFYRAMAYKAMVQTSPQFTFADFPHDWETNSSYWRSIDPERDIQVIKMKEKINSGRAGDISHDDLKSLLVPEGKIDKEQKAICLILMLDVAADPGYPDRKSSLLGRRLAVVDKEAAKAQKEQLARGGSSDIYVPRKEDIPHFEEKKRQAETIESAYKQLSDIESYIASPETYSSGERKLIDLGLNISRNFGIEDIILLNGNVSFAGAFGMFNNKRTMFLSRTIAGHMGESAPGMVDIATNTIIHELAHLLEEFAREDNREDLWEQGYVSNVRGLTHDATGGFFSEAMRFAAAVSLANDGEEIFGETDTGFEGEVEEQPIYFHAAWSKLEGGSEKMKWRGDVVDATKLSNIKSRIKDQSERERVQVSIDNRNVEVYVDENLMNMVRNNTTKDFDISAFVRARIQEYPPMTDEIVIVLLDESGHLFEDCTANGFVGVNKELFEIGLSQTGLQKILERGLAHELNHEALVFEKAVLGEMSAEDILLRMTQGIERTVEGMMAKNDLAGLVLEQSDMNILAEKLSYVAIREIALNSEVLAEKCLSVMEKVLARKGDYPRDIYSSAVHLIREIALNNETLVDRCLSVLKEVLIREGHLGTVYDGAADAIGRIALNNETLASKCLGFLEGVLTGEGFPLNAYPSAAQAIWGIARKDSSLIQQSTVTALEAELTREGHYPGYDACVSAANAICAIAEAKPALIKEGSLSKLIFSLPKHFHNHTFIHYQLYYNPHFIQSTTRFSEESRYSIGLAVYHLLKQYGRTPDTAKPEEIEGAINYIIAGREFVGDEEVYSDKRKAINICHEEKNCNPDILEAIQKGRVLGKPMSFKGADQKEAIKEKIRTTEGPLTIWFNGHGGPNHLWLSSGQIGSEESENVQHPFAISYKELASWLKDRGSLGEVVLLLDSCYSYDFTLQLLNEIKIQKAEGLPIVISAANMGRIAGMNTFLDGVSSQVKQDQPLFLGDVISGLESKEVFKMQDSSLFVPNEKLSNLTHPFAGRQVVEVPAESRHAGIPGSVTALSGPGRNILPISIPEGVTDLGFEGGIGEIDTAAFDRLWVNREAWQSLDLRTELGDEAYAVITDRAMGSGYERGISQMEVRLVDQSEMGLIVPENKEVFVVRDGNRILVLDTYWQSFSDETTPESLRKGKNSKLNLIMHEAMADWCQRNNVPADDIPMLIEGLLKGIGGTYEREYDFERRLAHLGVNIDRSIDGEREPAAKKIIKVLDTGAFFLPPGKALSDDEMGRDLITKSMTEAGTNILDIIFRGIHNGKESYDFITANPVVKLPDEGGDVRTHKDAYTLLTGATTRIRGAAQSFIVKHKIGNLQLDYGVAVEHALGVIEKIGDLNPGSQKDKIKERQSLIHYSIARSILDELTSEMNKKDSKIKNRIEKIIGEKTDLRGWLSERVMLDIIDDKAENEKGEELITIMPFGRVSLLGIAKLNIGHVALSGDPVAIREALTPLAYANALLSGRLDQFQDILKDLQDEFEKDNEFFRKMFMIGLPEITKLRYETMRELFEAEVAVLRSL
ncbi:MAG: tetratricopeptide repeat protein [Candidatus Omnitrophota bacterium]